MYFGSFSSSVLGRRAGTAWKRQLRRLLRQGSWRSMNSWAMSRRRRVPVSYQVSRRADEPRAITRSESLLAAAGTGVRHWPAVSVVPADLERRSWDALATYVRAEAPSHV